MNKTMEVTNLKQHFVNFYDQWESYVKHCQNSQEKYYVNKNHVVHDLIINTITNELQSLVDARLYKVKGSVGQSSLAGIPWLAVMDREVTESTQNGFYISYLFSRNASKLYLSIALGATQFTDFYGDNNNTILKIENAKDKFVSNFNKYGPTENFETVDLRNEEDSSFIRRYSKRMLLRAEGYSAGSMFTKSYNLHNPNFDENEIINDLNQYIDCYRKISLNPISKALLDVLDEAVYDEDKDKKKSTNFDYEIPIFNPSIREKSKKKAGIKSNKKPSNPSTPSKQVGDAGEQYVYEYECYKLSKINRQDLVEKIIKQYEDLSYFPGYDIKSFDKNGNEIFIEVKSTKSKNKEFFEITENEKNAAERIGDDYFIYQVTSALTNPSISSIIQNPIKYVQQNKVMMEPLVYRVSYKNKQ